MTVAVTWFLSGGISRGDYKQSLRIEPTPSPQFHASLEADRRKCFIPSLEEHAPSFTNRPRLSQADRLTKYKEPPARLSLRQANG